jgi:hypothetical protein
LDQVDSALFSKDFIEEPTTCEEAFNCERKEDQIKWKDAMKKRVKGNVKSGL